MFEGPVTGNIPEVLDNGEVTDGTHVTAGQLALALTPYAQVTDLAVNTAAAGNNAAAIQSLDDRVTAELASKLDSSALAPAIAPLATAAALATTDGQVAAHGSSIAALQSSLTTGLSNKADQSAFDVLEGVVATKSTPDGVDLKLSNYSTMAAMNGSIASANNATLATVAANYGLKTVVDQHSLDIAARITPLEVDTKVANALLGAVTAAALASELASRDASISGLQASKADASALTAYALQSAVDTSSVVDSKIAAALLDAVTTAALDAALAGKADASALASLLSTVDGLDTPLDVDTKIANALLGLATEAFVAAQLASRDASITALQASKADAALLASYATNAALSASETALQSALDAILAELAALQLSGSGVVNAPAWAGFTTWELLRGSSVVRNLHFVAPLSAALANGDDTLSITADYYSVAAADAALAAALLAYYTSSQVDTLLGDYRTGTAQDAETTSAITGALLAYYTAAQVDALLGDYRTASAQDTQTQAAIAGALLAYRTGPDQDVFTTNQITSALVAYRSAADQDTATASSIAAALLSYYTIAQVDGLLAGKLGVTEAASALQIAVRFPDDGGADEVVAAIGEQILAPTDVSLSNWTVRPSSGCSVVLATHTAGVSVDGYTLTLAVNPWNIVRTYNLTPGRELLFACRYRLGTASNFVVYMSEADNIYDPLYGSFVGDQGAWSTAKMYFTVPPNGVAKLHFGAHFQAPGLPNQTADVYGLQILDATLETGTAEEEDTAASALLLKHEFLDGGADDVTLATLGEVLLEPTLTTLGNFLVRSNSQSSVASASFAVGGFQLEGYAMTLSAFAWNIVRTYTLTPGSCRYRLGTASNLVMYVSAADNDYVGVTGTFLGTPSQGVWSTARLDFSVPPGGIAKLHFGAFGGSIPGLVQQSAGTLDLYSMQIRASAFEGESVSVTDLLADSLALTGSATLDGLTAQGNVGCDQLLCNDVNCTDVFTTGVDASGAVSCAALTATGTVAGAALSSAGAVSGSSLSISGAASVGLLSSATGITGSTLTINNTANAGRRVHGHADGLGRSNRGELRSHRRAHGRHADDHRCGLRGPAGLREPGLHLHGHERRSVDGQRGVRRRGELGHGLRAAALRLQHAHRDQHLGLLGRSLPDEELGGLEQAASVQQQRGPRQRPGAAAAGQPEREGLPGAGRRGAPVRAHHDQRRGAGADQEPLHAAVPDHEPEEPRLPRDRGQHGQRGLQHELHEFVGQPGEDGDGRGRRGGAPAALRLRGGQAVQAPGHERRPEAGLRLGRLRRNEVEEFDGHRPVERRHGDGYSRLLSSHQRAVGGVQGLPGPAGRGGSLAGAAGAEEGVKTVRSCVSRPPCIQGTLLQAPFWGNK